MIQKTMYVVMAGLKNNFLVSLASLSLLFCVDACHSQNGHDKIPQNPERNGFLKSGVYTNAFKTDKEREVSQKFDRELFTLIGEDAILDKNTYDFYVASIYKRRGDTIYRIYILKSSEDLTCASYKEVDHKQYSNNDGEKLNEKVYTINSVSRIIPKENLSSFKLSLDTSAKLVNTPITAAYDAPFHIIIYFDGKKYYRLSNFLVDQRRMDFLNDLFQNSRLFKD